MANARACFLALSLSLRFSKIASFFFFSFIHSLSYFDFYFSVWPTRGSVSGAWTKLCASLLCCFFFLLLFLLP